MTQAGFEPAIPAAKRPQTYALGLAVTEIGQSDEYASSISRNVCFISFPLFIL
jgi:hypothetical protein